MGLFDRFRSKKAEKPPETPEAAPEPTQALSPDEEALRRLVSEAIGPVTLRQLALGDLLDGQDWNIDFQTGELKIGSFQFPIQFLGSESEESDSWMWGVNNINGFPAELLESVKTFYESSTVRGTTLLSSLELPLGGYISGHHLAILAAASFPDKPCYYRCPYQGGAAFVLLHNVPEEVYQQPEPSLVVSTLQLLIQQQNLDHYPLVEATLQAVCNEGSSEPDRLTGTFETGETLTIAFDDLGRIANIKLGT